MFKKYFLPLFLVISTFVLAQKEYYELRTYTLPFNGSETVLHEYLSDALLPALNRNEVENIGVFEALGDPTPKKIVLLIPYKGVAHYEKVLNALEKDTNYLKNKKTYDELPLSKKVYTRFSSSFYFAFEGIPQLVKPAKGSMLFELRTYEGYSENAVDRKTAMFNDGELSIFEETGLHSVFFGSQVSGPLMPALTYMLAFKDMEERDTNWSAFIDHPEWKRISVLPEYANTVSDIKRTFLKPLAYSQL
ncbi:NIPSNAP family protein [Flavobacteriaceae bacterium]|jgi:hypothetical protein|nr:NIPSNAP family protein [Flavobacteriaceae bacterium]MDC3368835.1 NIPSNAP family protein [Flavobacteriaceae bacterium]